MSETRFVQSEDARIAVELGGDGIAVLMIPSLGRGSSDFATLARALQHAGLRTLAMAPRGVGRSSPIERDLSLGDFAADAAAVIEQMANGPAHVIGHAFGNRVARYLARMRPDCVRSLVLLAAGGLIEPHSDALAAFSGFLNEPLTRAQRLSAIARANFAPGNDASPWLEGWWPDAARAQIAAARSTPAEHWWIPPEHIPLLVVQGLQDRMAPPANGRALREALGERLRLVELDHAGHALLVERPDAVGRAVLDFLGA